METYYVTQEQFDLIEELKLYDLPLYNFVWHTDDNIKELAQNIPDELDPKVIRYIGGDETISFKVKETLYRLWRIDSDGEKVYMKFSYGTPDWTSNGSGAFTTTLEEIKKWQTPAWEIEEVN